MELKLLKLFDDGRWQSTTLVPIVEAPDKPIPEGFPGLSSGFLPVECWSGDDSTIWTTAMWGSRACATAIKVSTGAVERVCPPFSGGQTSKVEHEGQGFQEVLPEASFNVLAATENGGALVSWSSPIEPGGIGMIVATPSGNWSWLPGPSLGAAQVSSMSVPRADRETVSSALNNMSWKLLSVQPTCKEGTNAAACPPTDPFEAILIQPPPLAEPSGGELQGLIVVPHGGPHSVVPTIFVPSYAFLAIATGCAVLHVNYRGSPGFGKTALESLPGKIGEQDVSDVVAATKAALHFKYDPEKVAVVGASHGGFLAAHLIGQYPEIYKVATLHNPVTNIPSMVGVTDIPDWCHVEAIGLGAYDFSSFKPAEPAALASMWARSPVAHLAEVRAPTLILLGAKDRRVPMSQGEEYYHALRSLGVKTRLLLFPEDNHAIGQPASEAERLLHIVRWLMDHLFVPRHIDDGDRV